MREAAADVLTGAVPAKPRRRLSRSKRIIITVKIVLTVALLSYILLKFDFSRFQTDLVNLNWPLFSAGVFLGVVFNVLKFYKWHYLLRSRGVEATFMDAFISYALGNSVGVVTPGRAGELARTLYFPESKRKPIWGLVVYDRLLDVGAMFVLGIPGAFIVTGNPLFGAFIAAMAIVLFFLGFHSGFLSWTWRKIKQWTGKQSESGEMKDMVARAQAAWAFVISLVAFGVVLVQMYAFVRAFQPVSPLAVGLAMPLVILSNLIPITHLGLGVRENVAQATFAGYGVADDISVFCAFIIFVINTLLLALVGAFFINKIRFGQNDESGKSGISR